MTDLEAILARFRRWLDDWTSVADEQWLLAQMAGCQEELPAKYRRQLDLPPGSTYANAVQLITDTRWKP